MFTIHYFILSCPVNMDIKKVNVCYDCIYCRNHLCFDKKTIVRHFQKGCRKMKNRCSDSLIVEANGLSCHVYMNEKNCHLDVKKDILPKLYWPDAVKFLTTSNNWKTVHGIDSDWSSSEEDEGEDQKDSSE